VAPLLGRPLLAWTVDAALSASRLTRLVLSTEDKEIAKIGQSLGVEVPFLRPMELANDNTRSLAVLQDVVRRLEAENECYDAVFTLQPTNPLRIPNDIDGAIQLLEKSNADSVLSLVNPTSIHPFKMKTLSDKGWVEDPIYAKGLAHEPRQSLPVFYSLDGSVYLTTRKVLLDRNQISGRRTLGWMIPQERAINIDSPYDLWLAEQMLARLLKQSI
jgi:CMP-N-acetylneuraminic acid synthetase